jgi:hypothetical protein
VRRTRASSTDRLFDHTNHYSGLANEIIADVAAREILEDPPSLGGSARGSASTWPDATPHRQEIPLAAASPRPRHGMRHRPAPPGSPGRAGP